MTTTPSPAKPVAAKCIDLDGLPLDVLADKHDVVWYQLRKTFEEKTSLLYQFIRDEGYVQFIDVGANVGLISILANRAAPELHCIALEADPRLVGLMRRNLQRLALDKVQVINAIVGAQAKAKASFSLNPGSSLDNRVSVKGWEQIRLPMVRLDDVLRQHGIVGKTFIKIDTQGFEYGVLRGGESWLRQNKDWVIKMEFAPNWLRSQDTDPLALLAYLQDECGFEVAEFAERIPFGTPDINALFTHLLKKEEHAAFLQHVVSLDKGGLGWVDLLVRPKKKRRLFWHG